MMADAMNHSILSAEEERSLCVEYAKTKNVNVRNTLIMHNVRFVNKIANEYPANPDLVSEGYLGLIRGIEKFDPERGLKLGTYVGYWIRAYMLSYIVRNARLVKLGTTQAQRKLFFKLNKEKARLAAMGSEITPELIAEHLQVDKKDVEEMETRLEASETRLDATVGDSDKNTRLDRIAADGMSPDEALENAQESAQLSEKLQQFRAKLNRNEQFVFDLRMIQDQTLQEVGDQVGVTRERIRQLEAKLTDRLRKFCLSNNISPV